MIAKSFPGKQVCKKKIFGKNFCRKFLWLQNHFLENRVTGKSFLRKIFLSKIFYDCKIISWKTDLQDKYFWENFLVKIFLWLQNHFLENRFTAKSFLRKMFCRKFFMIAKSFPGKQVCKKTFLGKRFWSKFFYGCKIISSKTGLQENHFREKVFVENFL